MTSIDAFLDSGVKGRKRICLVTSIFHGFGKIGGFGTMAKSLAIALVDAGYDVVVAVPRRKGQAQVTEVNGFTVLGLTMSQMVNPGLYAKIGADLYHSQSPNLMSVAAKIGNPGAKHVITCRDPRTIADWFIEIRDATWRRKIRNVALMMFEEGPLVSWAIRRADCVAYAARFLEEKINWMYRPRVPLTFLPNIERVPNVVPTKSERPTACFVGRFDRRKRPELYIELAKSVPDVQFLMVGRAEDANWQRTLEKMAKTVSNLTLLGYIDKFDDDHFYDVYDSSWVFINTASREAHPLTFFEAAGRGCAILSHVNPDDFASKFGFWAADEDFESGLRNLLDHGDWQKRGEIGYEYVKKNYNYEKAVRAHTDLYAGLLRS